jgi:hypothetical protein
MAATIERIAPEKESQMLSMARMLIHSHDIPDAARDELRAAFADEPERQVDHLAAAARLMHAELELECSDARELVGLAPGAC